MTRACCATGGQVMLLSCSGGSNVGQLANQAAVELTQEGYGRMFCLAGIGGGLSGFVQSARDVPAMVAIDGCAVGCAKAVLENAGVAPNRYVVITDLGIEKNKDFQLEIKDLVKVKAAVKACCTDGGAGSHVGVTPSTSCSKGPAF